MATRLDLTAEELVARVREQNRARASRYRARHATARHVTHTDREAARHATPPPSQTLPPPGLSTTDRLLERLAPFANRAFKPDPAFLAKLAECYPGVDLELELAAALDWLEEPRHAKRRCSKGFLANWIKKADADRKAREALPPPATRRELVLQGQSHIQPQSQQRNTRPDYVKAFDHDLTPIRPAELQRFQAERRKLSLEQRMAQWKGAGK